ncbi:hypothetical protein HS088_TW01G00098 [Tripterygium wilfordii]|uniref:FLZ-type domain-containing protein n=1 Tax=Tripterygium wilfordii TaxID=458696 RepID=A0A7J7E0Y7_TRIWF|nr:FCS-Like Zinc finger 15-like isoform X1 [Tripterygium wilfordii]KAF5752191.1 hypothetical protein HS088_TW01G00098 [Tripterygium wilfordii]
MRDDDMVGLSIILETQKGFINHNNKKTPQVINKATMINKNKQSSSSSTSTSKRVSQSSPFPVPTFLEHCFLCRQKLLQGKDIYMYKGDRAFCSVECRCRQIFIDEEESPSKDNCSLAAMKPSSASAASSSSPSGSRSRNKGPRNRTGGFAY